MIQNLLRDLGFTEKESLVYIAILQKGKIAPTALSRLTGLNRTTIYSVTKELVNKGVISQDLGTTTLSFVARAPQDLSALTHKEEREIEQKKIKVAEAIGELQKLARNTPYHIPKITFISDSEIEDYLYKQTHTWHASVKKTDRVWWGFQDQTFVKNYETWIDWTAETDLYSTGITVQLLSNELAEKIKKKQIAYRKIKFWDKSKDFTATTWVCGDHVVMIVTNQRPHYLVEIYDGVLANNLRGIFKGIWETLI